MSEGSRGALSEKVAVVTGAGSGLGRAAALALARQGARVVVADFDTPRMERTVDEILHLGTSESALALETDVRDDASVRGLARGTLKAFGQADVIVNAAAVLLQGKLDRISSHDWDWMLQTNVLGPVRVANAFLPHLTQRATGHIVNVAAYGGVHPGNPLTVPYDAGHAALIAFTEGLARHLQGSGVRVSLFCLGASSPPVGQNTRSRGIGRWIGDAAAPQDGMAAADRLAGTLIDGLHHPRFAIAGDPADREALARRWPELDQVPVAAATT